MLPHRLDCSVDEKSLTIVVFTKSKKKTIQRTKRNSETNHQHEKRERRGNTRIQKLEVSTPNNDRIERVRSIS